MILAPFFCYIFNRLTDDELRDLKKISICQDCDDDSQVFPFVNDSGGKVFLDLNDDSHPLDRRVNEYRNAYISVVCS